MRALSLAKCAIFVLCLALGPMALAQARRGALRPAKTAKNVTTPIDEFMRMSPVERQKALNRLPPAQRRRLEERLRKFNELPVERQQELKSMYNRLNQLPPEQQQVVRRSLNQFSQQPADRKEAIRQELKSIAPLSAQQREERLASPEFREKFSDKEQGIIRDMSQLLPPK